MHSFPDVIIPPHDIKDVIYKTSWYTINKGPEFEKRLKEKEALNLKFSFLNPNDPYYRFYEQMKAEILSGTSHDTAISTKSNDETIGSEHVHLKFERIKSSRVDFEHSLLESLCNSGWSIRREEASHTSKNYTELLSWQSSSFATFEKIYEQLMTQARHHINDEVLTSSQFLITEKETWTYPVVTVYIDYHSLSSNIVSSPKKRVDLMIMSANERNFYFRDARFDQSLPLEE